MTHEVSAWHYIRHTLFGLRSSFRDKTTAYASKGWGCLDANCPLNSGAPEWLQKVLKDQAK